MILEIPEPSLIGITATMLDVMTRLRIKGFKLSVDHFGYGVLHPDGLSHLPLTELKVSRVSLLEAEKDQRFKNRLIAGINLAKLSAVSVVAVGVETQEEWELVFSLKCDQLQGFLVSQPMPAEEFLEWKKAWSLEAGIEG